MWLTKQAIRYSFALLLIPGTLALSSTPVLASDPPFQLPAPEKLKLIRAARITTSRGAIYVRLYPEQAPWHVANFKYLSDRGFYNNLPFHIYEANYVIQSGAPNEKPNSGPGYTLPPEFNAHKHTAGTLSMVRRPNELDVTNSRRSHGSQFRFILKEAPHLDGQYTAFGQVLQGMDVLNSLRRNDRVEKIEVFVKRH